MARTPGAKDLYRGVPRSTVRQILHTTDTMIDLMVSQGRLIVTHESGSRSCYDPESVKSAQAYLRDVFTWTDMTRKLDVEHGLLLDKSSEPKGNK